MTCSTCRFSTNKDIIVDPDKIDLVEDVEPRLPRCANPNSRRDGLFVFHWMKCDQYERA